MKIDTRAIEGFLRKPDPKIRAVLFFGPDEGLVSERATIVAKTACPDLADPFRAVELTMPQLRDDAALLADEFAAMSLTGGRRVVRVRPAGEEIVPAVENLLDARAGDALVVLEAGDLKPTSALRKLAESAPEMAAIACYADGEAALASLLDDALRQAGLKATPDAREWIVDNLGGDRAQTRSEIEKLILFKGRADSHDKDGAITLDEAMAILGDTAEIGIDDVVNGTWDGNLPGLDRALDRVFAEGTSPIQVLRRLQRHANQLHLATAQIANGASIESVVAGQRPALFYERRAAFMRQLRIWNTSQVGRALSAILEAEMQCKSTGMPDRTLTRRLCLQLAHSARRAQARAR